MKRSDNILKTALWRVAIVAICLQPVSSPGQETGQRPAADEADEAEIEVITVFGRVREDSIRDIPQSVSVFNQEVLTLSPITTVGDVIRFVPTASRDGSTLNAFGDTYLIRGFGASQTINGLGHNRVAHARDTANVERVEVLKGPASVLYGQMEPGAVVNVVTKQPLDEFYSEFGVEYGRYNDQRYTVDITGPIANGVKGRLNVAYRNAETFMDFWDLEHLFVAPNLTFELTPATTMTFEGVYSTNDWGSFQNGTPAQGAFLPNPNGEYPKSFNPDEPDIGFTVRDSVDANLRVTHEFSDSLRARASYTYTRNEADFQETFVVGLADDFRTLSRFMFVGRNGEEEDHNFLFDVAGDFATGALDHRYVVGFSYREFDGSRPARFVAIDGLDLFDPVYGLTPNPDPDLPDFFQQFEATEFFIQDRISIGDRLHLLAGVRYTDAGQDTNSIDTEGNSSPDTLDEENWSTQIGFLYDVNDEISVYGNRSESFVPQFGTSSGGAPFDAETGTQYEIGGRFAIGDLQANTALFLIVKDNVQTSDPDNPGFDSALGEVEARGFEFSLLGDIRPNWMFGAAYGYVDTEITENFDGVAGNRLRNTPENTVSMMTRYDFTSAPLDGLGLGGTVEYVDSRFGNDDNTFEMPSHTRVDLAAYYTFNDRVQADVFVNNVFDEEIYSEGFNILRVVAEPGTTYMVRLKVRLD